MAHVIVQECSVVLLRPNSYTPAEIYTQSLVCGSFFDLNLSTVPVIAGTESFSRGMTNDVMKAQCLRHGMALKAQVCDPRLRAACYPR